LAQYQTYEALKDAALKKPRQDFVKLIRNMQYNFVRGEEANAKDIERQREKERSARLPENGSI